MGNRFNGNRQKAEINRIRKLLTKKNFAEKTIAEIQKTGDRNQMNIATFPKNKKGQKLVLDRMVWSYSRDQKPMESPKEKKLNYGGMLLAVLNWRGK